MKKYVNYHKHDHISSFLTPDTHIKAEEFVKRAIELGDEMYFTTNHGTGGDIFEAKTLCDKYGLRCMFGIEGYIVPNPLEKDKSNYHIIIIPRTDAMRKQINYINSHAHIDGYYYKPRIFPEDLLALNPDEVYITTACVTGLLKDDKSIEQIFIPLCKHFGKNMFVEVQAHNVGVQIEHNIKCLEIAKKYGLELIAATDSHYIYPEQAADRKGYLEGKGLNYGDEDEFLLDYPDGDTLYQRFIEQGVLSPEQIDRAMENTFIFKGCEDIQLNHKIKMPTIYPDLTPDEKVEELRKHVYAAFEKVCVRDNIPDSEKQKYVDEIEKELKVVEDTKEINTADYFLFNEKNTDLAVNKYGGILTRTGRGSCGAFYLNNLLGMTQIDMLRTPVKLYSERFASVARLLENKSLPDVDFNVVSQEPFQKASKELLGEHGCYPMIAYGTMQEGEAFRNVCRSHGLAFEEYNQVAKDLDNYRQDEKWKPLIEESNKYVGAIVSASVHPCAHVLDNKDLRYEYGVVRVGDFLCVMMTSAEADEWKSLKNDYLIVSVWKLISETFQAIGKPIMTIKELENALDDKTFNMLKNGLTSTLNQVDGEWATKLAKQYGISSLRECAMFTAALRPSFESWRDLFISRNKYDTQCPQFDKVLKETDSFILFQENLMQFFEWLGISPAESIGLIKKISKKKIKQEDFDRLESRLHTNWISQVGNDDKFQDVWSLVQSCIGYGFCSAHAVSTGYDMLYGAYLKSHYPLWYYTVCFNNYNSDEGKIKALTKELPYFGIKLSSVKFRRSSGSYRCDPTTNTIYKGMSSIKFLNASVSDQLYAMRDQTFDSFIDLLNVNPCDTRQTTILIKLNYFSEFGKSQYLLDIYNLYCKYHGKKIIKKDQCEFDPEFMLQFATETDKQYKLTDSEGFLKALCDQVPNRSIPIKDYLDAQSEYLGYIDYVNPKAKEYGYVMNIDTKYSPKLTVYELDTGKTAVYKMPKKVFATSGITQGSIIKFTYEIKAKTTLIDGEWKKDFSVKEPWIDKFVVKEGV